MNVKTRKNLVILSVFLFTFAICYLLIESFVQLIYIQKSGIIRELELIQKNATGSGMTIKEYAHKNGHSSLLGWGQESQKTYPTYSVKDTFTILFIGDSVTYGFGVNKHEEFVYLINEKLNKKIRIVNLAVSGYGIDQMWLKLLLEGGKFNPDLVLISFIDHDLLRPANNFLFTSSKPKFKFNGEYVNLELAEDINKIYIDYSFAKNHFLLAPWLLKRYTDNLPYYLPELNEDYYKKLYDLIINDLNEYAVRNHVPIKLINLSNSFNFNGKDTLKRVFDNSYSKSAFDKKHLVLADLTNCTKHQSTIHNVDFNTEFNFHPQKIGHEIISECIISLIEKDIQKR